MATVNSVGTEAVQQYKYSTTQQSSSSSNNLSMQDFLTLIVAQMQNQDLNSDQDNTQFMAQMAQMASMQAMQDLTTAFMSSMSMSFIGKNVKASAYVMQEDGVTVKQEQVEGIAETVRFKGGSAEILVGGIWFKSSDVTEVGLAAPQTEDN